MSRSASAMHEAVETLNVTGQLDTNHGNRNSRHERSNKGRRRRAAAEQRRIDQQRWGQYITEGEEDSATQVAATAPRSNNRRRARRNNRTNSNSVLHLEEEYYEDEFTFHATSDAVSDDFELEMALSLSLSLADPNSNTENIYYRSPRIVNMSYESLIQLESVKCVASADVVNSMLNITFNGNKSEQELTDEEEKCAICQCEYECGDHIMSLPCTHGFHYLCGSEWLLNYSKLCPICKLDVTDKKCVDM